MGDVIPLRTYYADAEGAALLKAWRARAEQMEMLYECATLRYTLSEAMVKAYEQEFDRLRAAAEPRQSEEGK